MPLSSATATPKEAENSTSYCIGALNILEIGFNTPQEVSNLDIISQVALGFIAFTIGNEFRLEQLRHMGRQAITVGIAQAVFTTVLVDIALVALHFINPTLISISSAITLQRKGQGNQNLHRYTSLFLFSKWNRV